MNYMGKGLMGEKRLIDIIRKVQGSVFPLFGVESSKVFTVC